MALRIYKSYPGGDPRCEIKVIAVTPDKTPSVFFKFGPQAGSPVLFPLLMCKTCVIPIDPFASSSSSSSGG